MRLKVLIVDDEELARKRLTRLLQKHGSEIESIREAADGLTALKWIRQEFPDLLFLDIHMPGLGGFQLLSRLKAEPFIIFVTSYEEYALKAFEEKSVDYLLKPVSQERLDKAFDKLRHLYEHSTLLLAEQTRELLRQLTRSELKQIYVITGDRIIPVPLNEITYIRALEKNTVLHTVGEQFTVDYTLEQLQENLSGDFLRIHRSYIVNTNLIREVLKWFGGRYKIILKDREQTSLTVSRRYAAKINWSLPIDRKQR